MNKEELLNSIAKFIEENDMYSELRNTPTGHFLLLENQEEDSKIYEFVKQCGFDELPCECGYNDEYIVCDNCGKVVRMTPDSAFWKQPYLRTDGGDVYCDDCVEIEDMLEHMNHKFNKCDTIFSEKDYLEKGFKNYSEEKYGVKFIEETKKDYETLMEEVSNYEYAIILLVESTPFECETILFVK